MRTRIRTLRNLWREFLDARDALRSASEDYKRHQRAYRLPFLPR